MAIGQFGYLVSGGKHCWVAESKPVFQFQSVWVKRLARLKKILSWGLGELMLIRWTNGLAQHEAPLHTLGDAGQLALPVAFGLVLLLGPSRLKAACLQILPVTPCVAHFFSLMVVHLLGWQVWHYYCVASKTPSPPSLSHMPAVVFRLLQTLRMVHLALAEPGHFYCRSHPPEEVGGAPL